MPTQAILFSKVNVTKIEFTKAHIEKKGNEMFFIVLKPYNTYMSKHKKMYMFLFLYLKQKDAHGDFKMVRHKIFLSFHQCTRDCQSYSTVTMNTVDAENDLWQRCEAAD